ncbi:hypothetical protein SAY87_022616 [Trapa incisa]|uniref:Uncharacterized protein n=1 Tax=Trapa incisa TaxID=236973 RepID=A0AAN7Q9G7_9MYRT|nr:hypothetical protein SAY87_022616 [Trapa incisa]
MVAQMDCSSISLGHGYIVRWSPTFSQSEGDWKSYCKEKDGNFSIRFGRILTYFLPTMYSSLGECEEGMPLFSILALRNAQFKGCICPDQRRQPSGSAKGNSCNKM